MYLIDWSTDDLLPILIARILSRSCCQRPTSGRVWKMSFGSWPSKRWRGFSWKIPFFMALWYVCSGLVLFANKYLLTYVGVDADLLGCVQILSTTLYGSIQLYVARLWSSSPGKQAAAASPTDTSEGVTLEAKKYDTFYRDMILIGAMR